MDTKKHGRNIFQDFAKSHRTSSWNGTVDERLVRNGGWWYQSTIQYKYAAKAAYLAFL
jgi:hypothetical protein